MRSGERLFFLSEQPVRKTWNFLDNHDLRETAKSFRTHFCKVYRLFNSALKLVFKDHSHIDKHPGLSLKYQQYTKNG